MHQKLCLSIYKKRLKNYEIKTQIYTETDKKHRLMCTNYNDMHSLINKMYYSDDVICLERKRKLIEKYLIDREVVKTA